MSYFQKFVAFIVLLAVQPSLVAQDPIQRIAFLAGVTNYKDKDFGNLDYPENDVRALEIELKNLGFKVNPVIGTKATKAIIDAELDRFLDTAAKLAKDDIVFICFSGHGQQLVVDGTLIPFFCPYDAVPYPDTKKRVKTLVSLNRMLEKLKNSGSLHNLIAIDACRDNPAKNKGIDDSFATEVPRGVSILFSAKSGQRSWESSDDDIKHGVFSHFLLKGFQGEARNRRGQLTWDSLVEYVREEVPIVGPSIAGSSERIQNPHFIANKYSITRLDSDVSNPKNYTSRASGMQFALIPHGTFIMGSTTEAERGDDETSHQVTLTQDFYLGKYEVTQAEFNRVMKFNPSNFISSDRLPVETVTWFDAVEFCNQLSRLDGRQAYYTITGVQKDGDHIKAATVKPIRGNNGYRLPTEAEWEYACRGGTKTPFSFGANITTNQVNYDGNYPCNNAAKGTYREKTIEVDALSGANAFGLFQMHGNVLEWCWDWKEAYPSGSVSDPVGPDDGLFRVLRGGWWSDGARYCRSAYRGSYTPDYRVNYLDFRVAAGR